MSTAPFFIIGCGRSGTTLLRTLLNRHPEIAIPLESLFILDYLKAAPRCEISMLISLLVREPEIKEWGISPSHQDLDACRTITEAIEELHRMYLKTKDKKHWGQKTPRFIREADLLLSHFPRARFIHVVRDPRAVASSLVRSDVHRSTAYHASLRWRMDVASGLDFERRHPEHVLRIQYEELVREVEKTLRSILAFLDLPYVKNLEQPDQHARAEYSQFYRTIHENIDHDPTDRHIDKWKTALSKREIEVVEAVASETMQILGYEQEVTEPSIPRAYGYWMRLYRMVGLIRQGYQYLRYRRGYLFFLLYRKWRLGMLREFLWGVHY